MLRSLAFIVAILLPVSAVAQSVVVHNTGVDNSDVLVSAGAQTSFWTLLSAPGGATEAAGSNAFRYFNGAYAPDSASSAWVSPNASGNASVGGLYVYQLLVDLTGIDPATVVITGQFSTDNDGFIRLNGGASVATSPFAGFGSLTSFTLNSGFVDGTNSIEVGVNNGGNPTAFRVEFSSATGTPVPVPTMPDTLLLILALILVGGGVFMLKQRVRMASA